MNGWDRYRAAEIAVYVRKARNGDDPDDLACVRAVIWTLKIGSIVIAAGLGLMWAIG